MPTSFPRSRSRWRSDKQDGFAVSLGYPAAFHWTMAGVLAGLIVFCAYRHRIPLLAPAVLFLVWAVLSRLWSRFALRGLSAGISADRDRVFPGEKVELTFELINEGLPLPWVEIEVELPCRLTTGKRPGSPYTFDRRRWVTSISRGQVVSWNHAIEAKSRGDYRLGPIRLRTGDMFGLFPREVVLSHFLSVLVYPRVVPLHGLKLPRKALFGGQVSPRSIHEDASRAAGARDYRHDDPLKRIHWNASAAHGRLQTRQYDSSTSLSLILILDVHGFPEEDDEFEHAVSTLASMAREAERQGFATGLMSNGEPHVSIPIRSGRNQLMRVLEALARITATPRMSLGMWMDGVRSTLPMGATLVVVARSVTPAPAGLAAQLARDGHSLHWIQAWSEKPAVAPSICRERS